MEPESPKIKDVEYTENLSFPCSRLGRNALITVTRYKCTHENPADDHSFSNLFSGCANKFDCGIFVGDPRGAYHAVESLSTGCDAQKMIDEHQDIIM